MALKMPKSSKPESHARMVRQGVTIDAPTSEVWTALTTRELMTTWLSAGRITQVECDWRIGGTIGFVGTWNGKRSLDKGIVLAFEPERLLRYSYWSPFFRQPDAPESYATLEFGLSEKNGRTILTLFIDNLTTPEAFGHARLFWSATLQVLKKLLEGPVSQNETEG